MWNYSLWTLLPFFSSGFTAAGLWLVYFVAPTQMWLEPGRFERVPFDPPYIGLAARFPPASCIFGVVMNVSAFLLLTVTVLRYHQLKHRVDMQCLNTIGVALFFGACVGMLITGNVPFNIYLDLADKGSYMTFGLGLLYCWIQTYVTLKVNLMKEGMKVGIFRFLLSASITICLILYIVLMFQNHDVSAARFQWALVMLFLFFFSTFTVEFRYYHFSIECIQYSGPVPTKAVFIPDISKPCVTTKAP